MAEFAGRCAKNLRKTVVRSRDRAGFIGNGHFMRDLLHAIGEVERLAAKMPFAEAIYTVNRVSQDFLVRPMGIFQLIDYVGLDVCQCILGVMDARLPGQGLHSPLIDRLLAAGVKGGQHHDGSQKDGFLRYEQGKPIGVYDPDRQALRADRRHPGGVRRADRRAARAGRVLEGGGPRQVEGRDARARSSARSRRWRPSGADLARRYGARVTRDRAAARARRGRARSART